jgi:palmitoyltransferase ZDHHC13/17
MKDQAAPGSFGTWLSYSASSHPAAVSFIIMDLFLFFGVAVLTMVQASQVKDDL